MNHILISLDISLTQKMTEFNQALQSDACRLQQLQCHTAAPGHAFNQFFWGKFD